MVLCCSQDSNRIKCIYTYKHLSSLICDTCTCMDVRIQCGTLVTQMGGYGGWIVVKTAVGLVTIELLIQVRLWLIMMRQMNRIMCERSYIGKVGAIESGWSCLCACRRSLGEMLCFQTIGIRSTFLAAWCSWCIQFCSGERDSDNLIIDILLLLNSRRESPKWSNQLFNHKTYTLTHLNSLPHHNLQSQCATSQ